MISPYTKCFCWYFHISFNEIAADALNDTKTNESTGSRLSIALYIICDTQKNPAAKRTHAYFQRISVECEWDQSKTHTNHLSSYLHRMTINQRCHTERRTCFGFPHFFCLAEMILLLMPISFMRCSFSGTLFTLVDDFDWN